jgi:hypothetical protein
VLAVLGVVSCGGKKPASTTQQHKLSGFKFRAFVSNPVFPTAGINLPVINIVNGITNALSTSNISLSGESAQPGLMAISPDLSHTIIFSLSGNTVAVIDNTAEAIATAAGGKSNVPPINLPGATQSMFVANDNVTAYAAVPTATVIGQAPGAVVVMNLSSGSITATIPIAGAQYIVGSPDGNSILVFSNQSDNLTVIATALIGSSTDPRTMVTGTPQRHFDRPVWAIFIDNTTAYIFNCGPECGGVAAGVSTYTLGSAAPGPTTPVSGASYGLLSGNTLYVVGSPPHTACGPGTAAPTCGTLNMLNPSSLTLMNSQPILITDGYHNRMQMGANGQLFIGAQACYSVNISGGEVRGCLTIFNTNNSQVVIPPQTGDATGIQPVPGQTPEVVYVCQGGVFTIYDTTTDQSLIQPNGKITDIIGQSYDVKLVDPPPD